jgi:hypothetical protein
LPSYKDASENQFCLSDKTNSVRQYICEKTSTGTIVFSSISDIWDTLIKDNADTMLSGIKALNDKLTPIFQSTDDVTKKDIKDNYYVRN